jgi:hypothetical protein
MDTTRLDEILNGHVVLVLQLMRREGQRKKRGILREWAMRRREG